MTGTFSAGVFRSQVGLFSWLEWLFPAANRTPRFMSSSPEPPSSASSAPASAPSSTSSSSASSRRRCDWASGNAKIACDDHNPCTREYCSTGECYNIYDPTLPDCIDSICLDIPCIDDGIDCTKVICENNHCVSVPEPDRPECYGCEDDYQCPDDYNPCTTDVCFNGVCIHQPQSSYDCGTTPVLCGNLDCNDSNDCTIDRCVSKKVGPGEYVKECRYVPVDSIDCIICEFPEDCDDGNACTFDACVNNACINDPFEDCCTADSQCDDDNICTRDVCENSSCWSYRIESFGCLSG